MADSSAAEFNAFLRGLVTEALERPAARAKLRRVAADPRQAKRYKRLLELVRRAQPNALMETADGTRDEP